MSVAVFSSSALADFSSTDSSHLTTIYSKTTSIASYLSTYLPDIFNRLAKVDLISTNVGFLTTNSNSMVGVLGNTTDSAGTASVMGQLKKIGNSLGARGEQQQGIIDQIQTIRTAIGARGPSQSGIIDYVSVMYSDVHSNINPIRVDLDNIYDLLNADKEKQEDALDDYSDAGGRSASDTSSDVGQISGKLSSSFDSGVSASEALNAVDENEGTFEYFFFNMKDDLNTASSGGSSKAPLRGAKSNGSDVPDFLSDYWEGLSD